MKQSKPTQPRSQVEWLTQQVERIRARDTKGLLSLAFDAELFKAAAMSDAGKQVKLVVEGVPEAVALGTGGAR
ncbi:MAG: hypothetical protein FJ405_13735 [Verrucomicrobia bacterium]|nr:hypothetical protein [Verrucomicrobiota bacterium]